MAGGTYTEIAGGSITEIIEGDYNIYAGRNIITSAPNGKITETGVEKGVSYGKPQKPPKSQNKILKKFVVNFRRAKDFQGEYGFDWLRDEYIYPIVTVTNDNNGNPINAAKPLCKNVNSLKQEYRRDVKNPIAPYGQEYYPAWLSIFPHTTTQQFAHGSRMNAAGVDLDIEVDEIESLVNDNTELVFESGNANYLKVTPQTLKLSEFISSGKKTKNLGTGGNRQYYILPKKVNIKCEGGTLNNHEEIKVFAKLDTQKVEVGKLMVYKNNIIPKAEIVAVNVITQPNSATQIQQQLIKSYDFNLKRGGFNQALIRAEVDVINTFDINSLPPTDPDVISFKANFLHMPQVSAEPFLNAIIKLYNKYGKFTPRDGIDSNLSKLTFVFFTEISAGGTRGITDCSYGNVRTPAVWGNAYVIYQDGLINRRSIIHEAGHSLGLQHTFSEGDTAHGLQPPPHTFYQGYTENIMDYTWQVITNTTNPFDVGDHMKSFFKWQWDILRIDRSLTNNY